MKQQKYVTVLFETDMYKPLGVFITVFAYVTVVFAGNYLAFSFPNSTDYIEESSWKCENDTLTFFDSEVCSGVDISKENETFVGSFNEEKARRYITLFIRPKKRNEQLYGISMIIHILLNVLNENDKKEESFNISGVLQCGLNTDYCNPVNFNISCLFLVDKTFF
jgi:hypothetical protein